MPTSKLGLGVIEGFYGPPWSWANRVDYAAFLRGLGFGFYIFAPKRCEDLRRYWRRRWPKQDWAELVRLRAAYADAGLAFGIGLSPYTGARAMDGDTRRALRDKIRFLNTLEVDLFGLFFDDMPGGGSLVDDQAECASLVRSHSNASTLIVCPTYYSDDPVLARFSGEPGDYLGELGRALDPEVQVFWTGPEVCSKIITQGHLEDVARRVGREVVLWDNYPVNDGVRMSRYLHLSAFEGREAVPGSPIRGHAANPMNQALLSKIPLASLADLYRDPAHYDPERSFARGLARHTTPEFSKRIRLDRSLFEKEGLDALSPEHRCSLSAQYDSIDDPSAREVADWLRGRYAPLAADLEEFAQYQT